MTASAMAGKADMPGSGMAAANTGISVFSTSSAVSGICATRFGRETFCGAVGELAAAVVPVCDESLGGVVAALGNWLPEVGADLGGLVLDDPPEVPLLFFGLVPDCGLPPVSAPVIVPVIWLMVWLIWPGSPASGFGDPVPLLDELGPLVVLEPLSDDDDPDVEPPEDDDPDELLPDVPLPLDEPELLLDEPEPLLDEPDDELEPWPDEFDPWPDELDPPPLDEPELPLDEPEPPLPEPEWGRANAMAALVPPASRARPTRPVAAVSRRCNVTRCSPPSWLGLQYRTPI
ncbi:hypothetical protein [Mycobacterium sp. MAA66]|uniref:hypothetical protein n=1 Tax=Mycobacterium sp. MAA66 TaxID=3156297 RepID=UPI0035148648